MNHASDAYPYSGRQYRAGAHVDHHNFVWARSSDGEITRSFERYQSRDFHIDKGASMVRFISGGFETNFFGDGDDSVYADEDVAIMAAMMKVST